ncbi:MAG: hypothetical protein ACYSU0_16975, partial [Planctomycetota bacterium]
PARSTPGKKPSWIGAKSPTRSKDVDALRKIVEKRANESYEMLRREGDKWGVVQLFIRLENFKAAAKALYPLLTSRHTGGQHSRYLSSLGLIELEYARVMRELGKEPVALANIKEHRIRYAAALKQTYPPGSTTQARVAKQLAFVEGYREQRSRVAELEAAIAKKPDGETLLELAELCRPGNYKAELPLRWLTSVFRLVDECSDHPAARDGTAFWQLHKALVHHRVYEESIEILKAIMIQFPESEAAKNHDCLWDLAKSYSALGDMRADQFARRRALVYGKTAVQAYANAIKTYEHFKKTAPEKDPRNHVRKYESGPRPSLADAGIEHAKLKIASLSRR